MDRYGRNRIYVSREDQERIKGVKVLMVGAGIGGVIAECALRFGFERMTIVDGGVVGQDSLGAQGFAMDDIGKPKADSVRDRLLSVNPDARIISSCVSVNEGNAERIVRGHDIVVDTVSHRDSPPFILECVCSRMSIPVFLPCNLGWGGFLTILKAGDDQLMKVSHGSGDIELQAAEYVLQYRSFWNMSVDGLEGLVGVHRRGWPRTPKPQLSVGSWIAAGHCVNAMFNVVTGRKVKYFPKFYFSSLDADDDS